MGERVANTLPPRNQFCETEPLRNQTKCVARGSVFAIECAVPTVSARTHLVILFSGNREIQVVFRSPPDGNMPVMRSEERVSGMLFRAQRSVNDANPPKLKNI